VIQIDFYISDNEHGAAAFVRSQPDDNSKSAFSPFRSRGRGGFFVHLRNHRTDNHAGAGGSRQVGNLFRHTRGLFLHLRFYYSFLYKGIIGTFRLKHPV